MATVTGLTATRMLGIEAASIVAARMVGYDLVVTTHGGVDINLGNIRGIQGAQGIQGLLGPLGPTGAASTVPGPTGPAGSSDASMLSSGTVPDARLPVTSNAATVGGKLSSGDPSVTNSRTPNAHAASHATGGSDAVTVTKSQVGLTNADDTADSAKPVSTAQLTALNNKLNVGDPSVTNSRTPVSHASSHAAGGSDFINPTEKTNVVAASGTTQIIPDVSSATLNVITLNASCSFSFPVAVVGKSFTIILKSGGSFSVAWPASVKWSDSLAPALTTVVGKYDALSFVCVDNNVWLGFAGGSNF